MDEPILSFIGSIDTDMHAWFTHSRTPLMTDLFEHLTILANWQTVVLIAACVCVYLYQTDRIRQALPLLVSLASTATLIYTLKILVARPRPLDSLIDMRDFSFPSGHAGAAIALYGLMTYLLYTHLQSSQWRKAIFGIGIGIVFLIGVSRLYLGVHYLSDVVAGYGIGALGMGAGLYARHRTNTHGRQSGTPKPVAHTVTKRGPTSCRSLNAERTASRQ